MIRLIEGVLIERSIEMLKDKFLNFEIFAPHDDSGEGGEQLVDTVEIDDAEALRVAGEILDKYIDAFLELAK